MLALKTIQKKDLKTLWKKAYTQAFPKWAQLNAPYFEDYEKMDYETFLKKSSKFYLEKDSVFGIFVDEELIGIVSYYFESKKTRWLETGIVIYDEKDWHQGYGTKAMVCWFDFVFEKHPEIARIGITTWSENTGMMKLAEKLDMKLEARIRQVRYYQGIYYDSIKYGILREEWENKK